MMIRMKVWDGKKADADVCGKECPSLESALRQSLDKAKKEG